MLLLGGVLSPVGGSQKQVFEGVAQASQSNPGLLSRSEALALSGAINDMSDSERVIYLADVAENNIERVYQVENVLTKLVKDAKSVDHTSDFTEFFEALENVRSLKRFSHMFTHIEELRDLWPDVSRLNMFVDDLVRNESLLDLFKGAADNATRLRYSKAWNHLDLAESGSKVDPAVITKLADDILDNPALETFLEGGVGRVKAWEALVDIPNVRVSENALGTVSKWIDDEIELTFESIQDGAKVINKNGDEVGQLIKSGTEEFLEISDDFFVTSGTPKSFGTITVNSNTGEVYSNIGYVKNTDGTIGFIEDVSSYGNQLVQNTIKQRGSLRSVLTGIQSTEDAHHIIPVQLLKENDVVQAAIEAGFGFNTVANGMAVEKFVKATGAGRHGPHPNYTNQIRNFLNQWKDSPANANWTPTDAKNLLDGLVDDLKQTINTTTAKINDLNLDL